MGSFIHLIVENSRTSALTALKIISTERFDLRDFELLKSFRKKNENPKRKVELTALGPSELSLKKENVVVFPWESMA